MKHLASALFSLLLASAALTAAYAGDGSIRAGTWSISPADTAGQVQLELRSAGNGGENESDHSIALARLGLRPSDLEGGSHDVRFALRGEAGQVDFTGSASRGTGAGNFTFSPSASFAQGVSSRGIPAPEDRALLSAVLLDVTLGYIDAIRGSGVQVTRFDRIIALRALGATAQSAAALRSSFGSLDDEELITLTALHVDANYTRDLAASGYRGLTAHDVVTFRALHVDGAYIRAIGDAGYRGVSAHDLITLKALHIDGAFIRNAQAHGFSHPTIQQLIRLKVMNVL